MFLRTVVGIAAAAVLAGFFAGIETGLYAMSRLKLRLLAEREHKPSAVLLQALVGDRPRFLATVLVGHNIAVYVATFTCISALMSLGTSSRAMLRLLAENAELSGTILLSVVLFVFCEVVPKEFFLRMANDLMYSSARVLRAADMLLRPVTLVVSALTAFLSRVFGGVTGVRPELFSRQTLWEHIDEGVSEGTLSEHQRTLIRSVMESSRRPLSEALIPLDDAATLPSDATVASLLAAPVPMRPVRFFLRDKEENILGVVNLFDVLKTRPEEPLAKHARKPMTLDSSVSIREAIRRMQRGKQEVTLVVSPSGETAGVVTIGGLIHRLVETS